jgi:hypothetical protein
LAREIRNSRTKTCPGANLSIRNATFIALELDRVLIGEAPSSNVPRYRAGLCVVGNVGNLEDQGRLSELKTKLRGLSPRAICTDRRLSAKLVPTFTDRGFRVICATISSK